MKINLYPIIMLFFLSLFVSCKKDIDYGKDFAGSEQAWKEFKAASGNSYRYMVRHSSLAGFVDETSVTVEKGQVVGRSYLSRVRRDSSSQLVVSEQWEEDASSLGSHKGSAEPLTLDEIYSLAKNNWLKKRKNAYTYFEAKNNGMISLCGYVEDGCVDDCFIGISIGYIEKL